MNSVFATKMFLVLRSDSTPISLFFPRRQTLDIDMNDSRLNKTVGSDFFQKTAGQKRQLVTPQCSDHTEAQTVRRFRNFFFLSHHRL